MTGTTAATDKIYPWHTQAWETIQTYHQADRVPHALLFWGQRGIGKEVFSLSLAKQLLCEQQGATACGACKACGWFVEGTHPDFIRIEPQEGKKTIAVDSIRQMTRKISESSVLSPGFVVMISLCEQMNSSASNALLKILEEPVSSRFILVSERLQQIPQTIRSRCQMVFIPPASLMQSQQYIEQQGLDSKLAPLLEGAPLLVAREEQMVLFEMRELLIEKIRGVCSGKLCPLLCSDELARQDIAMLCALLQSLFQDIVMIKQLNVLSMLTHIDKQQNLTAIANLMSKTSAMAVVDTLLKFSEVLATNHPVNHALWLDDLMVTILKAGVKNE